MKELCKSIEFCEIKTCDVCKLSILKQAKTNHRNSICKITLQKLHDGDRISDEELDITIKCLTPTVELIGMIGKEYHIFWKELYFDLKKLEDFQRARKEKK